MHGPVFRGLQVEVVHFTAADADALLDRLLVELDPDPYLIGVANAVAYSRVLHGADRVARWSDRLAEYPTELAAAVAARHGNIQFFWRWRMFVERGNPHGLAAHFADVARQVEQVLCALNRRWWVGPRWPGLALADLALAPPDVARRLAAAATAPPVEAAADLARVVEETYDLLERHLPGSDPDRLRRLFRGDRHPWPPTASG